MAVIHPHLYRSTSKQGGYLRELELLEMLRVGLSDRFDVFHGLAWSSVHQGIQRFGELDLTVVSPQGHLLALEVKAGGVFTDQGLLLKQYGQDKPKDIGHQLGRQHGALRQRLKEAQLLDVHVDAMLVLPDHSLQSEGLAYPRHRIVDATQMHDFCNLIRDAFSPLGTHPDREAVLAFLSNQFNLVPDVGAQIGQAQGASMHLASGLATWVPRLQHPDQTYWIEATAGSGKTQLALTLLREAVGLRQRARYVCFNRPLADHLQTLAPAQADVTNFHQLCREHAERAGLTLNFADEDVFKQMVNSYLEVADTLPQKLDLLVIDECQDFDIEWVQALSSELSAKGRLYVLGDSHQQLYEREPFDLPHAVRLS